MELSTMGCYILIAMIQGLLATVMQIGLAVLMIEEVPLVVVSFWEPT
jgi:hypothetical protein